MKRIETEGRYGYRKLFDAQINKEKLSFETVGRDAAGHLILHRSETVNRSSAYGTADEYFILTDKEYFDYVLTARKNKLISRWAFNRLLKESAAPETQQGEIESVQSVLLHTSGMRGMMEEEILTKGDEAEISRYFLRYNGEKDERVLQERAVCPAEEVVKLLNDCRVLTWNGFHGPHPKGLLDGIMFRFEARVNGDQTIRADGSENFPDHYRDFTDGLYRFLNNK